MGRKDGGIRQGWNIIFMFAAGLDEEVSVEWVSAQWVTLGTLPPRLSGHRLGFVRLPHLSATAGQHTANRIQSVLNSPHTETLLKQYTCTHALLLWCKNPLLFCNDSHFLNQVLTSLELRLNNNTINNVVCVLLAYQILVAHTIVNNAQFCSVSAITPHRIAQQHHNNKG